MFEQIFSGCEYLPVTTGSITRSTMVKNFAAAFCLSTLLFAGGCSSMYNTHEGYFESASVPGWRYWFDDGRCSFTPVGVNTYFDLSVVDGGRGRVYLSLYFDLPKGRSVEFENAQAMLFSQNEKKTEAPLRTEVETYVATPDGNYRVESVSSAITEPMQGDTLHRENAIVWRTLHRRIHVTAELPTGGAEFFPLRLPRIRLNGTDLPIFNATFHWNPRVLHSLKKIALCRPASRRFSPFPLLPPVQSKSEGRDAGWKPALRPPAKLALNKHPACSGGLS